MAMVSVIVPVYNVEKYLHRCVDSILAQMFTDFELILVDDGSTDNCGAICDEYAQKDSRVHVIHQENSGLSAARNAGIDWVCGSRDSEWLCFVDSDDWVHPRMLEYLYHAVQETMAKICACNYVSVTKYEQPNDLEYMKPILKDGLDFYSENYIAGVLASNKIYHKSVFEEERYPIARIHEDEYISFKLLYRAGKIAWLNIPLYNYFQNNNGITKQAFSLARLNRIWALEEQHIFFESIGRGDLIRITEEKMLGTYYYQITELCKFPEYKRIQKLLIHKLYKLIMRRCTDGEFNPIAYRDVLPHMTFELWMFKRVILMLRQEGLRKTYLRLWRELFCRKSV